MTLFRFSRTFKDILKDARDAGAALVGGVDVIGNIQSGDIKMSDYQFVLAHPNILPDMVSVRGLMRRKFPNPRSGTLGSNLSEMVRQYLTGIQYNAVKDDYQQNYGKITTSIGTVSLLQESLRFIAEIPRTSSSSVPLRKI